MYITTFVLILAGTNVPGITYSRSYDTYISCILDEPRVQKLFDEDVGANNLKASIYKACKSSDAENKPQSFNQTQSVVTDHGEEILNGSPVIDCGPIRG